MIFYYSGTGNTLYAAEQLAAKINEECVYIPDALREGKLTYTLAAGESLGFVLPVYFWGIPASAEEFLSKLTITNEERPYTYLLFTCGGSACNAAKYVRPYFELDYVPQALVMPDNFLLMYDVAHPDDIKKTLNTARVALGEAIGLIRSHTKKTVDPNAGPLGILQTKVAAPNYRKARHTEKFWSNDNCTGCGYCAAICPVDAIEIKEGRPVWVKEQCDLCLACLQRCPEHASQYGNKTEKRGRYIHPHLAEQEEKQRNRKKLTEAEE